MYIKCIHYTSLQFESCEENKNVQNEVLTTTIYKKKYVFK